MVQKLLLTCSSLLLIGSSCFFHSVSGENKTCQLESFRVYTISQEDKSGQLLTAAKGNEKVVFKEELQPGQGRRLQWWGVVRTSASTAEKKIYRLVNTGNEINSVTKTTFVAKLTKDSKAYTLFCETCNKCLSSAEGNGTQSAEVTESPCDADDKKQQFIFTLKQDPEAKSKSIFLD